MATAEPYLIADSPFVRMAQQRYEFSPAQLTQIAVGFSRGTSIPVLARATNTTSATLRILYGYPWQSALAAPGSVQPSPKVISRPLTPNDKSNIRELRNIAELLVCCENENIKAHQVADVFKEKQTKVNNGNYITIQEADSLKVMELQIIKHFLSRYSPEEVCRRLGISRVTLWRKTQSCFNNEINEFQ